MRAIAFPNSNIIFNLQLKDPGAQPKKPPATSPFDYVEWGSTVYPGWLAVDQAAVAITETAPLLLTPGRRCQNGKPVPVDRADWKQYVAALEESGKLAIGHPRPGITRPSSTSRKTERRVRELPQGVSRQGRRRGKWSNSMPALNIGGRNRSCASMPSFRQPWCSPFPGLLFAQEWIEFASREDRFTCNFPSQPKVDADDLPIGARSRSAGARLQRDAGPEPLLGDGGRLQPGRTNPHRESQDLPGGRRTLPRRRRGRRRDTGRAMCAGRSSTHPGSSCSGTPS